MRAVLKVTTLIALAALTVPGIAQSRPGDGGGPEDATSEDGDRRPGAPGQACRRAGLEPGTPEFRRCVRAKARGRGQAVGRHRAVRLHRARGECRRKGFEPRTREFRECVREAVRDHRREVRERWLEAVEECRDRGLERPSEEFRECVRDEMDERREDRRGSEPDGSEPEAAS